MAAKILVVDDDVDIRRNIRGALLGEAYEIIEAGDGDRAVELLNGRFDLVITDFVHPGMDGLKLVKYIRAKWPETPIIFMTAYLSPNAAEALLLGTAEFMAKPFQLAALLRTVRRLMLQVSSPVVAYLTILQQAGVN
jgi:two-component system, cell cycle sensor histidine kinase and response regulator CckA